MFIENSYSYHQISTGKYKYFLSIKTICDKDGNPISYGLNFGALRAQCYARGKIKGCVTITVETYNPQINERFKLLEDDKKTANISWVGYNRKCSMTEDLPSGVGTRHMIKTAMTFVCKTYPWIENFSLTDASEVTCKEGLVVSLSALSLVINEKTYYEKYFKAVLKYNDIRNEYEKRKALLNDSSARFETKQFISKFKIPDNQIVFVENCYEETKTYLEFFRSLQIYCKSNNIIFCEVINSWLNLFLKHILGSPERYWMATWIIEKSNIKMIKLEEWNNSKINVEDAKQILQEEFNKSQSGGFVSGSFVLGDLE